MPGLREALEDKYAELEGEAAPDVGGVDSAPLEAEAAPDTGTETELTDSDRARDESGRFVAKPAQGKPAPAAPAGPAPASPVAGQGAAGGVPPPVGTPPAAPAFRAPQSWKAQIREKWGSLPNEVQQEVIRREKEVDQALQQRAEIEKGITGWNDVVRPYEAQMRAAGVKPEAYVGNLLQTAHALFYGPSHMKPNVLADIIMQSGVPPQDLDSALVARMQGRPAQAPQQQFQDPRLDKLISELESQKAEREQVALSEADTAANSFAESHEFFRDVAEDVAQLLDVAHAKGQKEVSAQELERYYQIACQMNENVSQTLSERRAVQSVATVQAATQRARAAASSVASQPTTGAPVQPSGRRAALEAKYDELDG